jgi:alpha-glucosidase
LEINAVARKNGDNWYVGAMTDEEARVLSLDLSFLETGKKYRATIYSDNEETSLIDKPTAIDINSIEVNSDTILKVKMAAGGGQAIQIICE